jgi:23S rRNA (cytidine1920-2'-O)/16S rRNA (cytidine1409-2'-O)-methyltransferase
MTGAARRTRLDAALVERGLVESRSKAQGLIMAGRVRVDGGVVTKAGTPVGPDAALELVEAPRYVSRGGDKLQTALETLGVDVGGELCLDVGASTGGFTDCLLQHGAARVAAVDVGRGQLHERIASDPRVTVLDGLNARYLEPGRLPFSPATVTVDVSFISLRLVLPAAVGCAAEAWRALALVKPQFEAGRAEVRRGVVRNPEVRRRVLEDVASFATGGGLGRPSVVLGVCDSLVPGPAGNREFFIYLAAAGHPLAEDHAVDVQSAIAQAVLTD